MDPVTKIAHAGNGEVEVASACGVVRQKYAVQDGAVVLMA